MNKPVKSSSLGSVRPRPEGFFPLLFCSVAMAIVLAALIINKFFFQFGDEPLSPIISQILILLIPSYVFLTMSRGGDDASTLRAIGVTRFGAQYIFFTIFASFFAISSSFLLNMIFGGTRAAADGFTIIGLFCAGENEFTVSIPYLIATYALIPAIVEEIAFRGFIFTHTRSVGLGAAVCLSSVISALFFFSPAQIPDALVCSLVFSFLLITTQSIIAPIVAHLVLNLFRLFLQTNMSVYFTSAKNTLPLAVIVLLLWLLSGTLFFTEATKIFRARAHADTKSTSGSKHTPTLASERLKKLWRDIVAILSYKPTRIAALITLALYIAITIIRYL